MTVSMDKGGCTTRCGRKRGSWKVALFALLFLFSFFTAFLVGRYPVTPVELLQILLARVVRGLHALWPRIPLIEATWLPAAETAVLNVRLPRILSAGLIGAGLSAAGMCYQGLFRNPMVSPDVLGASAGAGFGAALGLFFSMSYAAISGLSFGLGLLAVAVVQGISDRVRGNPVIGLVLGGIMVSSLFSSATSFLKLVADPDDTLPAITYWLMGSLASIRMREFWFALVPVGIGCILLLLLRWRLNVLTLEEDEARTMGVNTGVMRKIVVLCATLITAACVSVSGMIGWVGLVIPHFVRMMVGCDYRVSLPSSMLLGGSFLILVDDLARTIATAEVPLGILTSFVGAPFFLYLILREGKKL